MNVDYSSLTFTLSQRYLNNPPVLYEPTNLSSSPVLYSDLSIPFLLTNHVHVFSLYGDESQ